MPAPPNTKSRQFIQGSPVLHVPDVEAAARYYRDILGFTWDFGDAAYSVVWSDNSAVHFAKDDRAPAGVHLFHWVREVDAYHEEIAGRGAQIAAAPTNQPYGCRCVIKNAYEGHSPSRRPSAFAAAPRGWNCFD